MVGMATIASRIPSLPQRIPPLQNGDCLTREEFERRFDATPNLKKAELIEGVVYLPPPVSVEHGQPHFDLITFLGIYAANTPGVRGAGDCSVRMGPKNMPQPDVFLIIPRGGKTRISKDKYVEGPPELIAEVAASSASYDLHVKMDLYQRQGVQEYIVWRVFEQEIDWFVLSKNKFKLLFPDSGGIFRSQIFPGLWLDAPALLRGDFATVMKVLKRGLRTKQHRDFVRKLQANR